MFAWKDKNSKNHKDRKDGDFLKNPKILEVNLVKDNVAVSFDWGSNLLVLALTLLIASAVVAEIYFGLNWWNDQETTKITELQAEADQINQQALQFRQQADAALSYRDRAAIFSSLLDNHVHWTNFFRWLEQNTLSNVKYDGFSGDLSGAYSLSAHTDSFADVSWQVNSLLHDGLVNNIKVGSANFGKSTDKTKPSTVSFTMSLNIKPEVFKNKYDQSQPKK
jgi:hypothetical protein